MTDLISHPFRLDAAGHVVTHPQGSQEHAQQVAQHVLGCRHGERTLAPAYGLPDLPGLPVDEDLVEAELDISEPDIQLLEVGVETGTDGVIDIQVDVTWAIGEDNT